VTKGLTEEEIDTFFCESPGHGSVDFPRIWRREVGSIAVFGRGDGASDSCALLGSLSRQFYGQAHMISPGFRIQVRLTAKAVCGVNVRTGTRIGRVKRENCFRGMNERSSAPEGGFQ